MSSNLPRVTHKIFGENAGNNIGQFGSALAGQGNPTGDISQIQALPAWGQGWAGAVISERDYPTLEEMTGVQKVASQQIGYLFQKGIAEWDAGTTYYTNCFCQVNGVIYKSLTDNNLGNNPTTDETNWTPLELGGAEWGSISGDISEQTDLQQALTAKLNSDFSNSQKPYITETYQNGNSWYRVWSDGWIDPGIACGQTAGLSRVEKQLYQPHPVLLLIF